MNHQTSARSPALATLAIHAAGLPEQDGRRAPTVLEAAQAGSVVEERLAILEGGSAAVATVSGLAAHLLVLHALLDPGDEVLASTTVFGSARSRIAEAADEFGWLVRDLEPAGIETFAGPISPAVKAIVIESMTETGRVVDLAALAAAANLAKIPLVVDNTLATPALIRPVECGGDVVVHAGAVLLAGDDSAEGGFIVDGGSFDWAATGKLARPRASLGGSMGERFGNFALAAALRTTSLRDLGPGGSMQPGSATLLAGLATLPLRVQRQSDSALAVARHLAAHPAFEDVRYAGLDQDTGPAQSGPSGAGPALTARLTGVAAARRSHFIARLQLFAPRGPLGSTRSHAIAYLEDDPGALRLSIGLEDVGDLIADLDQAVAGLI